MFTTICDTVWLCQMHVARYKFTGDAESEENANKLLHKQIGDADTELSGFFPLAVLVLSYTTQL